MKADVEIAGHDLIVEYEIKITSHGYPASGPTYSSGGEPGAGAEFDIEILGLRFPKQHADVELVIPTWLRDIVTTHLLERDDINDIAQRMDHERDEGDPDLERDMRLEDQELDRGQAHDDEA